MLKCLYRGLVIKYPSHTDLLTAKEKQIYEEIEESIKYLENIKESGYSYLKVNARYYFIMYNEPELSQKEHLYFYDTKTKEFVKEISNKTFEDLYNARKFIKYKINEIGKGKQKQYDLIPDIKKLLFKDSQNRINHKEEIHKEQRRHIVGDADLER